MTIKTKVPMHPHEAEESILGSILISPGIYFKVGKIWNASDFKVHRNRWIWEAITCLHARRWPIDYLTVCDELDRAGKLAEAGGAAYLAALTRQTQTPLGAVFHNDNTENLPIGRGMPEAVIRTTYLATENEQ